MLPLCTALRLLVVAAAVTQQTLSAASELRRSCPASHGTLRVTVGTGFANFEARAIFEKWDNDTFEEPIELRNRVVKLKFKDDKRNSTYLQVGTSGANAETYVASSVTVQPASCRINGLAAEAELHVLFKRDQIMGISDKMSNVTESVLTVMVYSAAQEGIEGQTLCLGREECSSGSSSGSALAHFLNGSATGGPEGLRKVHDAELLLGEAMWPLVGFGCGSMDLAVVLEGHDGGADMACTRLHMIATLPVAATVIPEMFRSQSEASEISERKGKQLHLSFVPFPPVGPLTPDQVAQRRWSFPLTYVGVPSVFVLLLYFIVAQWKKKGFCNFTYGHCRETQAASNVDDAIDSARTSSVQSLSRAQAEPLLDVPRRSSTRSLESRRSRRSRRGNVGSKTMPITTPSTDGDGEGLEAVVTGADTWLHNVAQAEAEDAEAVQEFLNILSSREQWMTPWIRSLGMILHTTYVVMCIAEPMKGILGVGDVLVTCYEGIPYEAILPFMVLFVVIKICELALLAFTRSSRGQINAFMTLVKFCGGLASYYNGYSDALSSVITRSCSKHSWWGAMLVVIFAGIVIFHWTLLVVLSCLWDRSGKCFYKMLHMSVLAGTIQVHPNDNHAKLLWRSICVSQLVVQDLLMTSLQLWFIIGVESDTSMWKAAAISGASLVFSGYELMTPNVIFKKSDLRHLEVIAELRQLMNAALEDYDKARMSRLLKMAQKSDLLFRSEFYDRAMDFKIATEVQLVEGGEVRSYFLDAEGNQSPYHSVAKVIRVNDAANTAMLEFRLSENPQVPSWQQEVPRSYVVEDRELTKAMYSLGILSPGNGPERADSRKWASLLPPFECQVMKSLRGCQRNALSIVRHEADERHWDSMDALLDRCARLRIGWDNLQCVLEWIMHDAPIIIHLDLDTVARYLKRDTHYRNQFETHQTKGLNILPIREGWEKKLFKESYEDALPFERPKYGVLDVMNDPFGVVSARDYGNSYVVVKQARLRCTMTPMDSGRPEVEFQHVGTLDKCAHVLMTFSDDELREVARVAWANLQPGEPPAERLGDSKKIDGFNYKELQLHGELDLDKHVKRLVVHPSYLSKILDTAGDDETNDEDKLDQKGIEKLCKQHGWDLSWMGDPENIHGFSSTLPWEKHLRMNMRRPTESRWKLVPIRREDSFASDSDVEVPFSPEDLA